MGKTCRTLVTATCLDPVSSPVKWEHNTDAVRAEEMEVQKRLNLGQSLVQSPQHASAVTMHSKAK